MWKHTLPVQTFGELETELGKENFIIQGNVILNAGGSVQLAVDTVKVCGLLLLTCPRCVPVLGLCGCVMVCHVCCIQTSGSRIVFLNVDSNHAVGLLCQVCVSTHCQALSGAPSLHPLVLTPFRHWPLA